MQKEGDDNYIRLISSKGIARHIPNPNSTLRKQISAEGMDTQISQAFLSVAFFALQRKRQQNYLSKIINTKNRVRRRCSTPMELVMLLFNLLQTLAPYGGFFLSCDYL